MTTTKAPEAQATVSVFETTRIWALHLLCFVLPLTSLLFLLSAPHRWIVSLAWLIPLAVSIVADMWSSAERRQPAATMPGWPFDSVIYILAGLQLVTVALLVRMVAQHGFFTTDTLVGWLLVGVNSGYSGIVVAHELIHRPEWHRQQLGRLLLCSVLYDHFATEHIRGHHARVGRSEDPATARFGENAIGFFRRTVPAQFVSAWRLESRRLGDEQLRWSDPRMLRHRVLRGVIVEWGVALAILGFLGVGACAIYLLQALAAVRLLEVVNYFEHWGLVRSGRRVTTIDSWDTDSWFTLYTLVGLSRHADHHAYAARPYQQLRFQEESPKLPYGYFGTAVLVLFWNPRFRALATAELERRRLGPFATAA